MSLALQSKYSGTNVASPAATAFTSNNTAGSLLVVCGRGNLAAGITVADSNNGNWTVVQDLASFDSTNSFFMAYYLNCKAGANTVTVTSALATLSYNIAEYPAALAASFNCSLSAGAATGTAINSGTITTATASTLLIGGVYPFNTFTVGGSGWNEEIGSGTAFLPSLYDQVQTNAGAIAFSGTQASGGWAAGIMAFSINTIPATATFNAWTPKGTVIANSGGINNPGQANVLYEGGAVILSGNVFKMWYGVNPATGGGINYAESSDGVTWSQYSSNPVISGQVGSKIFKNGGTYYCYSSAGFNAGATINVYTSTDGVTWTLAKANAISPSVSGWDSVAVFQLAVLDQVGGVWYGYYTGDNGVPGNTNFWEGAATSTDLINWTKSPSNPIIQVSNGNMSFFKVGSVYYGWTQAYYPNFNGIRTDAIRFTANNVLGPWTEEAYKGKTVASFFASGGTDFFSGQSTLQNQLGDPTHIEVNGNTWLYYSVGYDSTASFYINAAEAVGLTLADLVNSYEGVAQVPMSGNPTLNFDTLASDAGTGSNSNPIGGNWTPLSTTQASYGVAQRTSNLIEPSAVSLNADSWWNNQIWSPDQWAQITVAACASSSAFVGVSLRCSTNGAATAYRFLWSGTLGGSGTAYITKVVNGSSGSPLFQQAGLTVSVGDTLTAVAIGTNLYFYYNGVLIAQVSDNSIASGAAGFSLVSNSSSAGSAAISAWSGGSFQEAATNAISGSLGAGGAGATVHYSGTSSGSVIADGSGNYTTGEVLVPNGNYVITPTKTGYTFNPVNQNEVLSGSDITGVNFAATKNNVIGGDGGSFDYSYSFG